jgi:hypothetical protein
LAHWPYIDALPPRESLTTPLFFSDEELRLLTGTNLFPAVAQRRQEWQAESEAVRSVIGEDGLTW